MRNKFQDKFDKWIYSNINSLRIKCEITVNYPDQTVNNESYGLLCVSSMATITIILVHQWWINEHIQSAIVIFPSKIT